MPSKRKKRRADGSLRPAYARSRRRRSQAKRAAWLARFEPGVRAVFFRQVDQSQAVWLSGYVRDHGLLSELAASKALAELADELGWCALITVDGLVVGIAPAKPSAASGSLLSDG